MATPDYSSAIASIESAGQRDPYAALGPMTKGDRAYGKYQIMGFNVGPWSKEILGRELSPQEFLADPLAQDTIFNGKFQQYVSKYGPEGAAQAWIGGPGGVGKTERRDVLGTSVGEYGKRFMAALGSDAQAVQQPPPVSAPLDLASFRQAAYKDAPAIPAYPWSPQQAPQAQPPQMAMADPPPLQAPQIQYYRPKRAFSFRG